MKILWCVLWVAFVYLEIQGITLHDSKGSVYIPGTDITEQLRTDLNSGLYITLPSGHFFISESIIVFGYCGIVRGSGVDETIIEVAKGFKTSKDPMSKVGFEGAEIFAVFWSKGDVTFKDFTILVKGEAPAEVHNNPFFGMSTTIDNAILVAGIHSEAVEGITVTFENLRIKGEDSQNPLSLNGKNLALPLIATGMHGAHMPINALIKNCEIENSGSTAIEYFDVFGGKGEIVKNRISNCLEGITVFSLTDSLQVLGQLTIRNNSFTNVTHHPIANRNRWSSFCLQNNTQDGSPLPDDCK